MPVFNPRMDSMPNDLAFSKFHALGNDYLVIDPTRTAFELEPRLVQALCDRHRGAGSDGLLLGPLPVPGDPEAFGLRIFNPDGSESEKSGNGLRIFARYLLEAGHVEGDGCRIRTTGGTAEVQYLAPDGSLVQVDMGLPAFRAGDIPFTGLAAHLEVLQVPLFLPTGPVTITALSVGNPHCVLFPGSVSAAEAQRLGPRIERHPDFPNRVSVQLVDVVDRPHTRLQIWERGARSTPAARAGGGPPPGAHAGRSHRHRHHGPGPHPHDGPGPGRLPGPPSRGMDTMTVPQPDPERIAQWTLQLC